MSALGFVRTFAKGTIEHGLIATGMSAASRRRHRSDVLVLAYHNILPSGVASWGDTSLHLPADAFERQLDVLARTHEVTPLQQIFEESDGSRPRVVITFDDAYTGALEVGIPLLVRRGMPATVFVTPGLLGQFTWWDLLTADAGSMSDAVRTRALTEYGGQRETVLRAAAVGDAASHHPAYRIATLEQLTTIAGARGITLGSHTWSHVNLAACGRDALRRELAESKEWLSSRFSSFVPWLSYPYGLSSQSVAELTAELGYEAALCVDGGWMPRDARETRYALPRCNIPAGLSTSGFRLRVDGAWRI